MLFQSRYNFELIKGVDDFLIMFFSKKKGFPNDMERPLEGESIDESPCGSSDALRGSLF